MAINNITQIKGSDTVETTIKNINSNFQQLASLNGGPQGPAGNQGVPGLPGLQGNRGLQGEKGEDGSTIEYVNKGEFPDVEEMVENVSYCGQDDDSNFIMRKLNESSSTGYDEVVLISAKSIDTSGYITSYTTTENTSGSYINPQGSADEARLAITYKDDQGIAWRFGDGSQIIGDSEEKTSDNSKVLIAVEDNTDNTFSANYKLKDVTCSLRTNNFITFTSVNNSNTPPTTCLCMANNLDDTIENSLIMSFLGGSNRHSSLYAYNLYAQNSILTNPGEKNFIGMVSSNENLATNFNVIALKDKSENVVGGLMNTSGDFFSFYSDTKSLLLESKKNIVIGTSVNGENTVEIGSSNSSCGVNIGAGSGTVTIGCSGDNFKDTDDDSTCDVNIGYGAGSVTIGGYQKSKDDDTEDNKSNGSVTIGVPGFDRDIVIGANGCESDIYIGSGKHNISIGNYNNIDGDLGNVKVTLYAKNYNTIIHTSTNVLCQEIISGNNYYFERSGASKYAKLSLEDDGVHVNKFTIDNIENGSINFKEFSAPYDDTVIKLNYVSNGSFVACKFSGEEKGMKAGSSLINATGDNKKIIGSIAQCIMTLVGYPELSSKGAVTEDEIKKHLYELSNGDALFAVNPAGHEDTLGSFYRLCYYHKSVAGYENAYASFPLYNYTY